jgi:hypothetical protein
VLAALVGGPALGQQPARPAAGPVMPARDAAGGARPAVAVNRTTLPQPGGGRVLYYQKPADSAAATGGPMGGVVPASAAAPPAAPVVTPDNSVIGPMLPSTARPHELPSVAEDQVPGTSSSNKQPPKPGETVIPPLPDRRYIFEMYDDATLERAVVQSIQKANPTVKLENLRFPGLQPTVPVGTEYVAKTTGYDPRRAQYEPAYVVHRRLHFEEKNAERYGWDLGFIQPFVSTAYFYKDVLLWPNSLGSGFEIGFWDTSAGKCLPGSPVPYYLYPPGLTLTGMFIEGGIVTGSAFILNPVRAAAPFVAP